MAVVGFVVLGIVAGVFSGLLGIGGGTVVVPVLVYFFHMTQHKAQGTILGAFLPPVALLAFWKYHQSGNTDIKAALFLALGLFIGAYFGAKISLAMPEVLLKRVFAVFLFFIAFRMMTGK